MTLYSSNELYRQIAFLAYYLHWGCGELLELPHAVRERFCEEVGRMNRQTGGAAHDIFQL